ncbi:MAG: hypothetical protein WC796_01405 [Candidatus Pacearchaeota archaeon]|jgi:hypothetical protein
MTQIDPKINPNTVEGCMFYGGLVGRSFRHQPSWPTYTVVGLSSGRPSSDVISLEVISADEPQNKRYLPLLEHYADVLVDNFDVLSA